jgi:hypothetical protein
MFNKEQQKSTTIPVNAEKLKELELLAVKLEQELYEAKGKLDIVTKQRNDALELFQKVLKGYSIVPAIRLWVDFVVKGD